jgi:UDP-N-acetylglucosamine:LPS N-acetylglucosamine transferase
MRFVSLFALVALCALDPLTASTSHRSLRRDMANALPDIERVDEILAQYDKLKEQKKFSKKSARAFEQWLCTKSIFLGSAFYDHNLVYKKFTHLSKDKKFKKAYDAFVKGIASPHKPAVKPHLKQHKKITVLYTGSYGGGHKIPATALTTHLEKHGHTVQLIDVDAISDRYSPVIEGFTRGQIYQEVFQKQGNAKRAHTLGKMIDAAQRTSQKRYLTDLRKMIADFGSDHIFAAAHHRPKLSYLSFYLGIPMTYLHTDFVFHRQLVPILTEQMKLKRKPVSFVSLSKEDSFLKNIYEGLKIKKKGKLPAAARKQIVPVGFPVRPSFVPVTKEQVNNIRDKLKIPHEAIVCKLAMGQNGLAREIRDILTRLFKEEKKLSEPFHLFVICGKNDLLREDIQKLVKESLGKNSLITVHLMGFLDEQEMAQIDKASDVWITKPGGSTCAELIKTQKQMLYVLNKHHSWELVNANYLKKLKLGGIFSTKKSIVSQVKERIREGNKVDHSKLPKNNWEQKAIDVLYRKF